MVICEHVQEPPGLKNNRLLDIFLECQSQLENHYPEKGFVLIVRTSILFILVVFLVFITGVTPSGASDAPGHTEWSRTELADAARISKLRPGGSTLQVRPIGTSVQYAQNDLEVKKENQPDEKSPLGATIRSMVLPGWGQFYTENRLKGILFAGAEITLFSLWWSEKKAGDRDMDEFNRTQDNSFYNSSTGHQNKASDYFSWGLVVYMVNMLDAYISAHLYKFDEKVRMVDEGAVEVSVQFY